MKQIQLLFLLLSLLATGAWSLGAEPAQETPPTPPPADEVSSEKPAAPVAQAPEAVPAVPSSEAPAAPAAEPAAPPAVPAKPAAESVEKEPPLRELGATAPKAPAAPAAEAAPEPRRRSHSARREVVSFGGAHLRADETADAVVSILGSSLAEGPVHGDVVSILGNSTAREDVHGSVVAVMGSSSAQKEVHGDVVAVLGEARVEGHVHGDVVSVLGGIVLGPNARIDGEVVSVGSNLQRGTGSVINGHITEVPFFSHIPGIGSLGTWFQETILKARLLSWRSDLAWTWGVALAFLALYALIALVFEKGVRTCAETLEQRPGRTILASFLALILTPPLFIVLSFTVLGGVALMIALFVGTLFGKAAFFAFLGRRITKPLGVQHAAVAVLAGGLIVVLLYSVPVLGLILWKLGSMIGLGMAVYTAILAMRREKSVPVSTALPVAAPAAAPLPATGVPGSGPAAATAAMSAGFGATAPLPGAPVPPVPPVAELPRTTPAAAVQLSASSLERVGFWRRFCASLIDVILIGIVAGLLHINGGFVLLYAAYHIVMWALRGTTVGGIILEIKVVRTDDRPLDWTVSLVRCLGAFLSLAIVGLGFIWVAFDDQRQSWHDKIAGTTIVRVPKGVSLI